MVGVELICSSCGAKLAVDPGIGTADCPYCGTQMSIRTERGNGDVQIDAIIPISTDRAKFYERVIESLAGDQSTPDDVILALNIPEHVMAVYVPYMRYRGTYEGDFTCEAGREDINYVMVRRGNRLVQEKRTDIAWEPFQRQLRGPFTIDVCLGKNIEDRFIASLQDMTVSQDLAVFKRDYVNGHSIEPAVRQAEPDELFRKRGKLSLELIVSSAANQQAPRLRRNLRTSHRYNIDQATPFLAAVWSDKYSYGGVEYTVLMDGGSGQVLAERPQDKNRLKHESGLRRIANFSILAALVDLCFSVFLGQPIILVGSVLAILIGFIGVNNFRQKIRKTSVDTRNEIVTRLKTEGPRESLAAEISSAEATYKELRRRAAKLPIFYWGASAAALIVGGALAVLAPKAAPSSVGVNTSSSEAPTAVQNSGGGLGTASNTAGVSSSAATVATPTGVDNSPPGAAGSDGTSAPTSGPVTTQDSGDDRGSGGTEPTAEDGTRADISRTFDYFSDWNEPNNAGVVKMLSRYANQVNFYGDLIGNHELMKQKWTFAKRWPDRNYNVRSNTVTVNCNTSSLCVVQGIVDYSASNPETGLRSSGVAQFSLGFRNDLIAFESGRVLSRGE